MRVIEYESNTVKKSSGTQTAEKRLYVSKQSANRHSGVGFVVRNH
ncbi:hypothetical protein [uncultured Bacteroides sp.]|nr:hypothetical protein [uncultured Bacteroides sp.]